MTDNIFKVCSVEGCEEPIISVEERKMEKVFYVLCKIGHFVKLTPIGTERYN